MPMRAWTNSSFYARFRMFFFRLEMSPLNVICVKRLKSSHPCLKLKKGDVCDKQLQLWHIGMIWLDSKIILSKVKWFRMTLSLASDSHPFSTPPFPTPVGRQNQVPVCIDIFQPHHAHLCLATGTLSGRLGETVEDLILHSWGFGVSFKNLFSYVQTLWCMTMIHSTVGMSALYTSKRKGLAMLQLCSSKGIDPDQSRNVETILLKRLNMILIKDNSQNRQVWPVVFLCISRCTYKCVYIKSGIKLPAAQSPCIV